MKIVVVIRLITCYMFGLLKLNGNYISGNLLKLRDFLRCQKQRVVLNGQHPSWDNVNAGVRQGSFFRTIISLLHK